MRGGNCDGGDGDGVCAETPNIANGTGRYTLTSKEMIDDERRAAGGVKKKKNL
jgi:hypothetical protein